MKLFDDLTGKSCYTKIISIEKIDMNFNWLEKLFLYNTVLNDLPYLIKLAYFDDDPYFSSNIPLLKYFLIENEDDNIEEFADFLTSRMSIGNSSLLKYCDIPFITENLDFIEDWVNIKVS
jgi:hypothetical protein